MSTQLRFLKLAIASVLAVVCLAPAASAWYSPTQGRFVQRDPIGSWPDRINRGSAVAYVGANPHRYVDSMGLKSTDNWHDLPSELTKSKEFRRFVESEKKDDGLRPKDQYDRRQLWDKANTWLNEGGAKNFNNNQLSNLRNQMKNVSKCGIGLAAGAIGYYFLVEDAHAALDEGSSCHRLMSYLDDTISNQSKCNTSTVDRLAENCRWNMIEVFGSAYGGVGGAGIDAAFDGFKKDLDYGCSDHNKGLECPNSCGG